MDSCGTLISYGASVEEPDKMGRSALQLATHYGMQDMADYLVNATRHLRTIRDVVYKAAAQPQPKSTLLR